MKKLAIFLICMMPLIITFAGCGPSQAEKMAAATAQIATSNAMKTAFALTPRATPAPASAQTYKVIHETGLYSAFDIDADMITVLSVGTILVPADNKRSFVCDSFIEAGTTYTLCKIKMYGTGQTGWVLRKWVE